MNSSLSSKEKKNNYYLLSLALISGLLLWLGWPTTSFNFLLWVGMIPLLMIEEKIVQRKGGWHFFLLIFLSFLIWNTGTTWWIFYASPVGSIFTILSNSLLMCIPLILFRTTKQRTGNKIGYASFIIYWIAFEFIHLRWDLSWPWLTLGNGLASTPKWIQWYEYTGILGGSAWILLINLFLFLGLFKRSSARKRNTQITTAFLLIIIPLIVSYSLYMEYEEKGVKIEVAVVQPNIDPYTEKFSDSEKFIPFDKQIDRFISLSRKKTTDKTSFLLWPETAIDGLFYESDIQSYPLIQKIITYKKQYPDLCLLTGITSYITYPDGKSASATASYHENIGYYDQFNTAIQFDEKDSVVFYHKSKLVPGVEMMPYPQVFKFLNKLSIGLGGTSGQLGRQKERTVFFSKKKPIGYAPVICYESIYGDFVTDYIKKGAQFIFIITNDGWWENTPGHRQHLLYGRLRAIETRRSIARSANTGISAFINQRGDIIQRTNYWEQAVISQALYSNTILTFYTLHGDYLGRLACGLALVILLFIILKILVKKIRSLLNRK